MRLRVSHSRSQKCSFHSLSFKRVCVWSKASCTKSQRNAKWKLLRRSLPKVFHLAELLACRLFPSSENFQWCNLGGQAPTANAYCYESRIQHFPLWKRGYHCSCVQWSSGCVGRVLGASSHVTAGILVVGVETPLTLPVKLQHSILWRHWGESIRESCIVSFTFNILHLWALFGTATWKWLLHIFVVLFKHGGASVVWVLLGAMGNTNHSFCCHISIFQYRVNVCVFLLLYLLSYVFSAMFALLCISMFALLHMFTVMLITVLFTVMFVVVCLALC